MVGDESKTVHGFGKASHTICGSFLLIPIKRNPERCRVALECHGGRLVLKAVLVREGSTSINMKGGPRPLGSAALSGRLGKIEFGPTIRISVVFGFTFGIESIQFLRGIVLVNVSPQIISYQVVGGIFDSPQNPVFVKGHAYLVSKAVGKDMHVFEINGKQRLGSGRVPEVPKQTDSGAVRIFVNVAVGSYRHIHGSRRLLKDDRPRRVTLRSASHSVRMYIAHNILWRC
mmetsp:Transcript_17561/g.43803  ORF Transcript_17561/g.43803 Transcript_17561/m.43803 type:complete len:230 (+) Transcript_17561:393-1082(+)